MLFQCSLSVNDPFCKCPLPLIYLYIDSWDCVMSIIVPVRPYMCLPHTVDAYLPPVCSSYKLVHPLSCWYISLYFNAPFYQLFFCWWKTILISGIVGIVISGIVGILFCLFLQSSVLLMRPFCLSYQCVMMYDVLLMCPSLRFFLLFIYRFIRRLVGEYWCLEFEIDTTCPCHCQFVFVNRHPHLCW